MRSIRHATALITGAGRGIGKRLAIGFAQAGYKVGLFGRNQAELDVTKLEIEHAGGTAIRLRGDVARYEDVLAASERMAGTFGAVDTVIANAGAQGPVGPFAENKARDWQELFQTNVIGVLNTCRAVLPPMLEHRNGKILVVSCEGAATPRPYFAAFSASKAAVARFVESLAEEVRDQNVQVNAMIPGEAYTNMTDEILHAGYKAGMNEIETAERTRITGGTPPSKQIDLALFLASERSNHLTGKLIYATDDWKRLERENGRPDALTLRRHR